MFQHTLPYAPPIYPDAIMDASAYFANTFYSFEKIYLFSYFFI